jgi:hypothetical protein
LCERVLIRLAMLLALVLLEIGDRYEVRLISTKA